MKILTQDNYKLVKNISSCFFILSDKWTWKSISIPLGIQVFFRNSPNQKSPNKIFLIQEKINSNKKSGSNQNENVIINR